MLKDVVIRAQNGDKEAFEELYTEVKNSLYFYALKMTKNEYDAEDVLQNTFIEIISNINSLKQPEYFKTWATRICHNVCYHHIKGNTNNSVSINDEESYVVEMADDDKSIIPDEAVESKEFQNIVDSMIDSLPDMQRTTLLLYYYNDIPVSEIADMLGCPEGTVKSNLNYGRKKIKLCVEEYEKKHNVKLHSFSIPAILLALSKTSVISDSASKLVWSNIAKASSAQSANVISANAASNVVKTVVASTKGKIVAGVLAGVVAIAGIVGIVAAILPDGNPFDSKSSKSYDDNNDFTVPKAPNSYVSDLMQPYEYRFRGSLSFEVDTNSFIASTLQGNIDKLFTYRQITYVLSDGKVYGFSDMPAFSKLKDETYRSTGSFSLNIQPDDVIVGSSHIVFAKDDNIIGYDYSGNIAFNNIPFDKKTDYLLPYVPETISNKIIVAKKKGNNLNFTLYIPDETTHDIIEIVPLEIKWDSFNKYLQANNRNSTVVEMFIVPGDINCLFVKTSDNELYEVYISEDGNVNVLESYPSLNDIDKIYFIDDSLSTFQLPFYSKKGNNKEIFTAGSGLYLSVDEEISIELPSTHNVNDIEKIISSLSDILFVFDNGDIYVAEDIGNQNSWLSFTMEKIDELSKYYKKGNVLTITADKCGFYILMDDRTVYVLPKYEYF